MARKQLKNKPLVEAILEIRWHLLNKQNGPGFEEDPHYRLLLGRFSERIQKVYPFHESLPAASIPDNMAAFIVQHRFRTGANSWPLVQMGPGILSVNDTAGYSWPDFQSRCQSAMSNLLDSHPNIADLKIKALMLRYIDAIPFDFEKNNVFTFLREKMKVTLALPNSLFASDKVFNSPSTFSWESSFKHTNPAGKLVIKLASGIRDKESALIWETRVGSEDSQVPDLKAGFSGWLEGAHELTDDWFFKLIEGDLERRFSGD
ncbi:MAG: TIGR04255 family protein [Candidatus Aminicenantes bacterium]|nr:TIGR04255 family protein [Candidatus Aminicenantes bacterium]